MFNLVTDRLHRHDTQSLCSIVKCTLAIFFLLLSNFHSELKGQHFEIDGKAVIKVMDLDNSSDSVVVRQADGTLAVREISTLSGGSSAEKYYVGQPLGTDGEDGIIFWVDHTGEDGLVVSKDDLTGAAWNNGTSIGTAASKQYDGDYNTAKIIEEQLDGSYAAKNCTEYSTPNTSPGDWYLPSIDELNLMFNAKYQIGRYIDQNVFEMNQYYWSSTEINTHFARSLLFATGGLTSHEKDIGWIFKAIRTIKGRPSVQSRLDMGESPISIYASGQPLDSLYGKTYEGGLIFYVDTHDTIPDIKGLVAAPEGWDGGDDPLAPWGCEVDIIGAIADSIGAGQGNTTAILTECNTPGIAAYIAAVANINGKFDWHLPSIGESGLLWENLHRFGCPKDASPCATSLGGALDDIYWSSTQGFIPESTAFGGNTADGTVILDQKSEQNRVRPIRSF